MFLSLLSHRATEVCSETSAVWSFAHGDAKAVAADAVFALPSQAR